MGIQICRMLKGPCLFSRSLIYWSYKIAPEGGIKYALKKLYSKMLKIYKSSNVIKLLQARKREHITTLPSILTDVPLRNDFPSPAWQPKVKLFILCITT